MIFDNDQIEWDIVCRCVTCDTPLTITIDKDAARHKINILVLKCLVCKENEIAELKAKIADMELYPGIP